MKRWRLLVGLKRGRKARKTFGAKMLKIIRRRASRVPKYWTARERQAWYEREAMKYRDWAVNGVR